MRPDCVRTWSEIRADCVRQMDEQTAAKQTAGISDIRVKEVSQNTCIDRLIQYTISPWPKTAEKRDFKRGVTDGWTD